MFKSCKLPTVVVKSRAV